MRSCLPLAPLSLLFAATLSAQSSLALATGREVERLARTRTFWPGFDPLSVPLAVFDGTRTWLFRHPAPPPDFEPSSISSIRSDVREGRHPAVTSNSSADIGGIATATLLADGSWAKQTAAELAATAMHESFHVFQRTQHPHWNANEGDLLLYPVDDAELLALRRLESESLRRALAAQDLTRAACLGRLAVSYREQRFARMDSAFAAYERGTELNEGLAAYVQLLALGRTTIDIPRDEFPATEVRARSYTIGPAIAFLLDRLRPRWQESLEAHDRQRLDEVLAGALVGAVASPRAGCALSADDALAITRVAREDAAAVASGRVARRQAFDARKGWRVTVIAAQSAPLWPQKFDPLNVERVTGGLLHTRFVDLGNDNCKSTAIDEDGVDIDVLTEGPGPHPLFNGVHRVTVAGLQQSVVKTDGGGVSIATSGLRLECERAKVVEKGKELVVTLDGP